MKGDKMQRYEDEEEFFEDYTDENFIEDDFEDEDFFSKSDLTKSMEIDFLEKKLGREMSMELLQTAIKFCESSFLWKFRSPSYRVSQIEKVYKSLSGLVTDEQSD